jgi:phosphatidylglycerophosphatase A
LRLLAEIIATGLGIGWVAPFAPATWGSAAALVLYWALPFEGAGDSQPFLWLIAATLVAGAGAAGVITSPPASPPSTRGRGQTQGAGEQDPKRCVIDEFAGMWATCLFLPVTWGWMLAAFVVFRALDIAKPFGIRRLERLPGGLGVMADDLAAGLLGAAALNVVRLALDRL